MSKQAAPKSVAATVATSRARKPRAAKPLGIVAALLADAPKSDDTKTAPVAAPVAAPVVAEAAAPVVRRAITHAIRESFRPSAGAMLAAHTAVFIRHSGMDTTPVPSRTVREVIGDTAIAWHMKQKNLVTVQDRRDPKTDALIQKGGIMLTPQGIVAFATRKLNAEYVSAYENVLTRGEADDRVLKNAAGMYAITGTPTTV